MNSYIKDSLTKTFLSNSPTINTMSIRKKEDKKITCCFTTHRAMRDKSVPRLAWISEAMNVQSQDWKFVSEFATDLALRVISSKYAPNQRQKINWKFASNFVSDFILTSFHCQISSKVRGISPVLGLTNFCLWNFSQSWHWFGTDE